MKNPLDLDEEPSPMKIEKALLIPPFHSERLKGCEKKEDESFNNIEAEDDYNMRKFHTSANIPVTPDKKECIKTSIVKIEDEQEEQEIRGMTEEEEEIGHLPNPSITAKSIGIIEEIREISPRDLENLKMQKSIGLVSDGSVKPRKGDYTPKSHQSEVKEKRLIKSERSENSEVKLPDRIQSHNHNEHIGNIENEENDLSEINPIPINLIPHPAEKTKNMHTSLAGEKNFQAYDIQQLSYDLVKEYSHLKIDKDETFMRRMLFDVFKRQTKEERMNKLIERNKIKIDENERIKTFNRLIEDANRRLEAQEKIEKMKEKLNENSFNNKKYKSEEWNEIYDERFLKYKLEKEKKIIEKTKEKIIHDKEKEDQIVESIKTKKAPSHVINSISKRMYEEAERRRLKMEENRRKEGIEQEEDENLEQKERDLSPSRFKKFKNSQKYKFQVL
jgi:hypothetical protein